MPQSREILISRRLTRRGTTYRYGLLIAADGALNVPAPLLKILAEASCGVRACVFQLRRVRGAPARFELRPPSSRGPCRRVECAQVGGLRDRWRDRNRRRGGGSQCARPSSRKPHERTESAKRAHGGCNAVAARFTMRPDSQSMTIFSALRQLLSHCLESNRR